jgi:hypothetical protein
MAEPSLEMRLMKLNARILAIREIVVVLLANWSAAQRDHDTVFRRISSGLNQRIDATEQKDDTDELVLETMRAEIDHMISLAKAIIEQGR